MCRGKSVSICTRSCTFIRKIARFLVHNIYGLSASVKGWIFPYSTPISQRDLPRHALQTTPLQAQTTRKPAITATENKKQPFAWLICGQPATQPPSAKGLVISKSRCWTAKWQGVFGCHKHSCLIITSCSLVQPKIVATHSTDVHLKWFDTSLWMTC